MILDIKQIDPLWLLVNIKDIRTNINKKVNKNNFSAFDIKNILNINYWRLNEWIRRGFITPSIPAYGHGTKAVFSIIDCYRIELFRRMLFVLNRKTAARLLKTLNDYSLKKKEIASFSLGPDGESWEIKLN